MFTAALCCVLFQARAQDFSRLRTAMVSLQADTIAFDSLYVVEGSMVILSPQAKKIDTSAYTIHYRLGTLVWRNKPTGMDSVKLNWRNFPFSYADVRVHKDISQIAQTPDYIVDPFEYNPDDGSARLIDFGTLDYSGSFSRGLSFGNNQDVVLNSSFNLQLAGKVTDDVEIIAALTDNNIPIQPEGNTQQIQEFDQVYIQANIRKRHSIIVGDYEISSPKGYFMQFFKNLQGGSYRGNFDINQKHKLKTSNSVAIARGKVTRNNITVQEGNQGPYQLTGENGETFIIVLAGSEKVYVNGELMKRGANFDYVIDYNLGEITFTPNVLITRDLRVWVEFEYAERNYFRSLAYTTNEYKLDDKLEMYASFYSEQDNKNQPVQADLTEEQTSFLTNLGDDINNASFPGYRTAEYDADRIMYKLDDDFLAQGDSVFVYTNDPDSAQFILNFSFVGQGNGNYVPSQTVANGRVYRYVLPVNGVQQGSYEPVIQLVTPKRQQIMTVGGVYTPTKNDKLTAEFGLSNNDLNTFSDLDADDDVGTSLKTTYTRRIDINKKKKSFLLPQVDYEFVDRRFKALQRFRSVEFTRDWNYTTTEDDGNEHILNAGISLQRQDLGSLSYHYATYRVVDGYSGQLHTANGRFNKAGYYADVTYRHLISESETENTTFIRPKIDAWKAFKKLNGWKIGGWYEQENNKIRDAGTDTLKSSSFSFVEWRTYIASPDSIDNKMRVEYRRRLEFFPENDTLQLTNLSNTYLFNGQWVTNPVNQLEWQMTYRQFFNEDSVANLNKKFAEYYLGRIQYNLNLFKGGINTNILYELGSGQEQRRSFTYLEVAEGQGNYQWIDYNENDVKEVNEFEPVPDGFSDQAIYIRVSNPTNEFDPVNITRFNQSLTLNPRAVWYGKKGFVGFLARFSTLTSVQFERKVFRGASVSPFNPFTIEVPEEELVANTTLVRNSLFFNRSSSKYSLEYTIQRNNNKLNLASGFETRDLMEHLVRIRWNISQSFSATVTGTTGNRGNITENFELRNYDFRFYTLNPDISYLYRTKFRVTIDYDFFDKRNTLDGSNKESAVQHQMGFEARYNVVSKSTINAKFSFAKIDFTGDANTALEFAMLEGLKDGSNFQWSAGFERTLANNVQITLGYEGRKTGNADIVHIGRATVRAIF